MWRNHFSMTVKTTCFLFHSLNFLLSDSCHPVKQTLFFMFPLVCFLFKWKTSSEFKYKRKSTLKYPCNEKFSYFIFLIFGYVVTLSATQPNFNPSRETELVLCRPFHSRFRGRLYLTMFRKFIWRLGAISEEVTHNVKSQFVPINQVSYWSLSTFSNTH